MESFQKELEYISKNKIRLTYDLFAFLLSRTETYEEVNDMVKKLNKQGYELNNEMYNLLFDLTENYTEGKKIVEQMKKRGFKFEPVTFNRVFWKHKNEQERDKAIKYFIRIFKREPRFDDFDNPTMLHYEYLRTVECRKTLKDKYTMINLLTDSSMAEDEFQKEIENIKQDKEINIEDFPKEKPNKNKVNKEMILRQENRHRFFYRAFAWWPT